MEQKIDILFTLLEDLRHENREEHSEIKQTLSNQRAKLAALAATVSALISGAAWFLR